MPRGKTQAVLTRIEVCRDILVEIQPASVRAVCYQLFVRGLLESMAKTPLTISSSTSGPAPLRWRSTTSPRGPCWLATVRTVSISILPLVVPSLAAGWRYGAAYRGSRICGPGGAQAV